MTELGRLDKDNVDRKSPQVAAIEVFAKVTTPILIYLLSFLGFHQKLKHEQLPLLYSFSGRYIYWKTKIREKGERSVVFSSFFTT